MRKIRCHPRPGTCWAAALALGLILGGCVRPPEGYHYTPSSSSSSSTATSKTEEEKPTKSRFHNHDDRWRTSPASGHRGHGRGGGRHHRGKDWKKD